MFGQALVQDLVRFVQQYKYKVEAGEEGWRQLQILVDCLGPTGERDGCAI